MSYKVCIYNFSQDEWQRNAANFLDNSIYQTWAYQHIRAEIDKQDLKRIIINDESGGIVIMCNLRIKNIMPLGLKIGYIQSGPLMIQKKTNFDKLSEAFKLLIQECLSNYVNILRIVPNIRDDEPGKDINNLLESCGFLRVSTIKPYHTIMVSLKEPEEEIRARFNKEWRRLLRKSEKLDIEVKEGTGDEFFKILEDLYAEAKNRKGFKGLDSQIFAKTQKLLYQNYKTKVLIAYYNDKPVTAHATTHFGNTAVPILTASNETGLEINSSYIVWWRTYQMSKSLGMEYYDLGGIDPKENPQGYLFKKRMGGEEKFYIGTYEICSNSLVKLFWRMIEKLYILAKR